MSELNQGAPAASQSSLSAYRRLIGYAFPYKKRLFLGIFMAMLAGSSVPALLISFQKSVDHFFGLKEMTGNASILFAVLVPALMVLQGVCYYISVVNINWVGFRVVTNLRAAAFANLQSLEMGYFGKQRAGDLISRISNDTVQVQNAVSSSIGMLIREPFILVGAVGTVIWKLQSLEANNVNFALLVLPFCLIPILILGRKVKKYARQNQERLAGLLSILDENIGGARIVRAFGMEQYEMDKFEKENERVFGRLVKIISVRSANQPIMQIIAAISIVIALLFAQNLNLTITDFITIVGAMVMAYQPIRKLGGVQMNIQQATAAATRVFELIDAPVHISTEEGAVPLDGPVETIHFNNLSFTYGEGPVLTNLNIEVKAGQCIALVGSSGSGKTTLVNLLPRFYEATGGSVEMNGRNIRDYTLDSLRSHIALVSQDTFLFNDSIHQNISYGSNYSREEVEEAARKANAHEFIMEQPQGYDTEIGDRGVLLSGGQKQRISIARALLRNAPILILDEATSALDNESERLVQAAINQLMEGRTVFAIAHRLSTVQHADRIIVLDKGEVVEEGNHEALLAKGGAYKRLYDLSFDG